MTLVECIMYSDDLVVIILYSFGVLTFGNDVQRTQTLLTTGHCYSSNSEEDYFQPALYCTDTAPMLKPSSAAPNAVAFRLTIFFDGSFYY